MGGQNTYRKGCWSEEEDRLLRKYVEKYGQRNWKHIPTKSGLIRSRKSCRLRWLNYLHPDIKRGEFGEDEDDLIIRLHRLLGNRWSLIAGRLPGRTGNDVNNYWNSCLSRKIAAERKNNTMNQKSDTLPNNWDPSEDDKDLDRKKETEEEESDTTTFWRSLLLEGELLENKGMMKKVEEDIDGDFFQGLGDLVQDMEFLVG